MAKKKLSKKEIVEQERKQLRNLLLGVVIVAAIIAIGAVVGFLVENAPDRAEYGNDISNTANGGFVVEQGENTYYSNIGIWVKPKDDVAYELTDQRAGAMAIYGDEIYFSNLSESNRCYKIGTDGEGLEQVTDFSIDYLNIVDDKLYFVCNKETGTRGVYSMDPDGGNLQKISDKLVSGMIASRGKLYYIDRDQNSNLYSMEFDGSEVTRITNAFTHCMTTDGKKLICSTDEGIFRMEWDGTEPKQLSAMPATSLLMLKNKLYYSCYSYTQELKETGIYCCNPETGKSVEKVRKDQAMYLGTGHDMLYFKSLEEGMVVMRSNPDGTEGTYVAGGEASGMLTEMVMN